MICEHILYITFLNKSELFLFIVKWFQVLQYNSYNLTSLICSLTDSSIWPIDMTLSGTTTPGQSGPESNGNEGVLHFLQISKDGSSPSDCLMSYPRHLLGESYPSAEMQSVYSTGHQVDWAVLIWWL